MVDINKYIEIGNKYADKYSKLYGFDQNNNYDIEKEVLKNSLEEAFYLIKDRFKDVYFTDKYNKLLVATGRGTGKSTYGARLLLYHIVFTQTDALSFKEFDNVAKMHLKEVVDEVYKLGIEKLFIITNVSIRCKINNNEIIFKGFKDSKAGFLSSLSIKNKLKMFGNIGLTLLDEANSLSYPILDIFIPSLRNKYNEQVKIIALFNPYSKESPIETYFKGRKDCLVSYNEFSIKDLPSKYRDVSLWNEYQEDAEAVEDGRINKNVFDQRWHGIPNEEENGLVFANLEEYQDMASIQNKRTIFAIDPAFGGGDTCTLSIVTQIGSNQFVFTGFSWKESIESCILEIEYILKELRVKEGFIEGNNLSVEFLSRILKRSDGFNLTVDKPRLPKNYRITQSLYTYMSYYNLELEYKLPNYDKKINTNLFFSNLFNYVLNSNKNDNEADALTYGIYYLKGLEI